MVLKILGAIVVFWLALAALAYVFQRKMIYFPQPLSNEQPAAWGMPEMQAVRVKTADGLSLLAWYRAPKPGYATIVYFHGNAGNLGSWGTALKPFLAAGYGGIMVDYRGYGVNPGKPSEQGLYADGRAVIEYLKGQDIQPDCMILFGRSMGSGVAVQLATEYPFLALVLQSPYTSLVNVGALHYPYLPVRLMQKDQFNSIGKISGIHLPLLVIYGDADPLVPPEMSQELYEAANSPKAVHAYPGVHHSDFPEVFPEVDAFLAPYKICGKR